MDFEFEKEIFVCSKQHTFQVRCITITGRPNLATQLLMRASTQVSVLMVAKGMASSHLLDWFMIVKSYQ